MTAEAICVDGSEVSRQSSTATDISVEAALAKRTVWPRITVVIVTYRAAGFISDCLGSLAATGYPDLRIVVVDNMSDDGTADVVRSWCAAQIATTAPLAIDERKGASDRGATRAPLTLVETGTNRGFAAGVNAGLTIAQADHDCAFYWILNPDATSEPRTPFALAERAEAVGRFAVIGGRVLYAEDPSYIQADGGRIHRLIGTAVSVNIGQEAANCGPPDAASLDYIPGVSMFVSRAFVERVGLLQESWFLYFEEIDWQLGRGDLPLVIEPNAVVLHRAGGSIGSGGLTHRAGPLSVYFTCRNLLPFVARWRPTRLPFAYLSAYYKLAKRWGASPQNILAALRGLHGLGPPQKVRRALSEETWSWINGGGRPRL